MRSITVLHIFLGRSVVCRQNLSDIRFNILESVWLIWFEGSGCDCLPM